VRARLACQEEAAATRFFGGTHVGAGTAVAPDQADPCLDDLWVILGRPRGRGEKGEIKGRLKCSVRLSSFEIEPTHCPVVEDDAFGLSREIPVPCPVAPFRRILHCLSLTDPGPNVKAHKMCPWVDHDRARRGRRNRLGCALLLDNLYVAQPRRKDPLSEEQKRCTNGCGGTPADWADGSPSLLSWGSLGRGYWIEPGTGMVGLGSSRARRRGASSCAAQRPGHSAFVLGRLSRQATTASTPAGRVGSSELLGGAREGMFHHQELRKLLGNYLKTQDGVVDGLGIVGGISMKHHFGDVGCAVTLWNKR